MRKTLLNILAGALLSASLLAACQSNPPTTQDEAVKKEAVVRTDSSATSAIQADSVPR